MIVQDGLVSTDDEDNSKRIIKEHYRIVKSSRARTVLFSLSAGFATTVKLSRPLESFKLLSVECLRIAEMLTIHSFLWEILCEK